MSFKRKLVALKHHAPDSFDIKNQLQVRYLVVWLEDQRIRHYKIEERSDLRNVAAPNWNDSFKRYLKDISCPLDPTEADTNLPGIIDWLLGFAVRLEYTDDAKKYSGITAETVIKSYAAPKVVQKSVLDNMDFESEEFKSGIEKLAQLLNVTTHPDHLITLEAICNLVKERFNKEALENIAKNPDPTAGLILSLKDTNLGFETDDYIMSSAAKVLRLLYIRDLRNLQTKINEGIVEIQTITANPKTDTRLGKVGI